MIVKWGGGFVAAIFLLAIVLLVFVPSKDGSTLPEGPLDVRIKALSSDITEVSEVGDSLVITHYQQSSTNGLTWVWTFFEDAKKVLSRVDEASMNKPYRQVVFMVKLTAQDNLGNKLDQLGMKVFYDKEKLNGANWQNMMTFDLLELPSDIEFKRLGLENAMEYCNDDDNAKHSIKFCAKAMDKGGLQ